MSFTNLFTQANICVSAYPPQPCFPHLLSFHLKNQLHERNGSGKKAAEWGFQSPQLLQALLRMAVGKQQSLAIAITIRISSISIIINSKVSLLLLLLLFQATEKIVTNLNSGHACMNCTPWLV